MTTRLEFSITFHTPFRVGTGSARDGLDDSVSRTNPLPGSSLKGLMRATGRDVIRAPSALLDSVFGTERMESPWAWTDAHVKDGTFPIQARIKIDEETMTAQRDFLFIAEQVESSGARFEIIQRRPVDPSENSRHTALLTLCALAVRQIGADRRRGLGWVTVIPDQLPEIDGMLASIRGGSHA